MSGVEGVRLTAQECRVALGVLRHYRLIELFLSRELGMAWDQVHAEAEVLERVLSEELEQVIAGAWATPSWTRTATRSPTARLRSMKARPTASTNYSTGPAAGLSGCRSRRRGRARVSDVQNVRVFSAHSVQSASSSRVERRAPLMSRLPSSPRASRQVPQQPISARCAMPLSILSRW